MIFPLALKLIGAAVLLLTILFIFRKRNRKYILIIFIIVAGLGVWQGLKEYNRTNKDLNNVNADIKITALELITEYEKNDSASNKKYLDKVLEVTGNIKEVNTDDKGYFTVVLGDAGNMSSVRCSMDTAYQQHAAKLEASSSITIRGACTGFNKDEMGLGSDVIMNRCVAVSNKNN